MKYLFFLLSVFLLSSCMCKTVDKNGGLIYEIELADKRKLAETIDILKNRVDYFCKTDPAVYYDSIVSKIKIELPEEYDTSLYNTLIQSKGKFEILETYSNKDLGPNLLAINSRIESEKPTESDLADNAEFKSPNSLFSVLTPMVTTEGDYYVGAAVGNCRKRDTALVNRLLNGDYARDELPGAVVFKWGESDDSDYMSLFAIKAPSGNKSINNSMVHYVRFDRNSNMGDYAVLISFKEENYSDWEKLTQKNIGNSLAICIDDKVYAAPIVQAAISGGKVQITGNLGEKNQSCLRL